jgi:hypothetical protein
MGRSAPIRSKRGHLNRWLVTTPRFPMSATKLQAVLPKGLLRSLGLARFLGSVSSLLLAHCVCCVLLLVGIRGGDFSL